MALLGAYSTGIGLADFKTRTTAHSTEEIIEVMESCISAGGMFYANSTGMSCGNKDSIMVVNIGD